MAIDRSRVIVSGYEHRIETLSLPDPKDRHVLAAAIECGAELIVTHNLKDFPAKALDPHGITAIAPDDFSLGLLDEAPGLICEVVRKQAANLKNPPRTALEVVDTLASNGLTRSAAQLRELLSP